jgi:hypothetical protein
MVSPSLTPDQAWDMRITAAMNLIEARTRLMARLARAPGQPADDTPQAVTRPDGTTVHRVRGVDGLKQVYSMFTQAQAEQVSNKA